MMKIEGKVLPYKLHLGCGSGGVATPEHINIDIKPIVGVDLVWDINRGIPFSDDSVQSIKAHDFLEHVDNLKFVLQEMYRVSQHGAFWSLMVPYWANRTAVNTLTHKNFFCENTFSYFDPSHRREVDSGWHEWGWNIWLKTIEYRFNYHSAAVQSLGPIGSPHFERAKEYMVNVIDTIVFDLSVVKDFKEENAVLKESSGKRVETT